MSVVITAKIQRKRNIPFIYIIFTRRYVQKKAEGNIAGYFACH